MGPSGAPYPLSQFLPCLTGFFKATLDGFCFLNSSQVPRPILIHLFELPCGLSALMTWLGGTPIFICTRNVNVACFGIFFLMRLGLRATSWLALGVPCYLQIAGGLAGLLLGLLLPQCLFAPVEHLWRLCNTF